MSFIVLHVFQDEKAAGCFTLIVFYFRVAVYVLCLIAVSWIGL